MNSRSIGTALALAGALAAFGACSKGPVTPAEHLTAADTARDGGDHQAALDLYKAVSDWKGEGTVSDGDKFRADLESVKCQVALGQAKEAVDTYKSMFDSHSGELGGKGGYKHTLAVLSSLVDKKADPMVSIDLLGVAAEKHPAQKENFGKLVEKLQKQGLSSEAMAKLGELGYL